MRSKRRTAFIILTILMLAALAFATQQVLHSRGALWRIVSENCIPAAESGGTGRCAEVSIKNGVESGHVVFKDRNGPLQYLLMPTKRLTGQEDPFVLTSASPAYWAEAWRARRWMEVSNGSPVPRDFVSITLNSQWGRSQNQLHLHVSCVRADLRSFLRATPAANSDTWTSIPGGWMGHPYEVRKLVAETLDGHDLFKDVAKDYPDEMGKVALAVVATQFDARDGFWLLRSRVDLPLWRGTIEGDVQDHSCSVIRANQGPDGKAAL